MTFVDYFPVLNDIIQTFDFQGKVFISNKLIPCPDQIVGWFRARGARNNLIDWICASACKDPQIASIILCSMDVAVDVNRRWFIGRALKSKWKIGAYFYKISLNF